MKAWTLWRLAIFINTVAWWLSRLALLQAEVADRLSTVAGNCEIEALRAQALDKVRDARRGR